MSVLSATTDTDELTLTVVADLAATPERAWQLWADPRQLERWWGPPTWPATVERHDLRPGGGSVYFMTGPDGTRAYGAWRVLDADEPSRLEVEDHFADESGAPRTDMPSNVMVVTLEPGGTGTIMTITSTFASADGLQQALGVGMLEGLRVCVEQIDGLLVAV